MTRACSFYGIDLFADFHVVEHPILRTCAPPLNQLDTLSLGAPASRRRIVWRTHRRDAGAPRLAAFRVDADSSRATVWRKILEQFAHRLGLARQDEFRRDFI